MEIEKGIHRVDAVRGVNVYVIEDEDGLTLVDTGIPGSAKKIVAFIERLGHRPDELERIVLTHADIDHIGGAAELKALTGARIAVAEEDAPVLRGAPPAKLTRSLLGRLLLRFFKARPAEPDELLVDGDEVTGFRVMRVPGHTSGSIALVREDGVVFSGDTALGDFGGRGGALHPPAEGLADDFPRALESFERIRSLKPRLVLPGHGAPARLR